MTAKGKKVMVFGTFDIIHPGHKNFLKQAGQYGDYLIIIIARDKTVFKVKSKLPRHSEKDRLNMFINSRLGDKVILGSLKNKYAVIRKYKPGIICLGYDQKAFTRELGKELIKLGMSETKIVRLKPYRADIYKTKKLIS